MKEPQSIGAGSACLLIKDDSLRAGWSAAFFQWLKEEGFSSWGAMGFMTV